MKKLISALAAAAVVTSMAVTGVNAQVFTDMEDTENIILTKKLGIASGYDDGSFKPNETVTRAEAAKMIVTALENLGSLEKYQGTTSSGTSKELFTDVNSKHWAYTYIQEAVANDVVEGYDDGTFRPDDNVTLGQLMTMLVSGTGYKVYGQAKGGYPRGFIDYAKSLGITEGVVDDRVPATREQVLNSVANALNVPVCVIDGYDYDSWGNAVPTLLIKDGEGADFQSLLTMVFDTYKVKATVKKINSDSLDIDITEAVNFDGEKVDKSKEVTVKATADDLKTFEKGKTYTMYIKVNDSDKKDYEILCGFLAD